MKVITRHIILMFCFMLMMALSGCFTGVESTKKITSKDVAKVVKEMTEEEKEASTFAVPLDSFANWQENKRFYVCDDNARLIFMASQEYDADTLRLQGKELKYVGYNTGRVLDNRQTVNIQFSDGVNTYTYATDKTISELKPGYTIPFLIDMDEVDYIGKQLSGRECYVKTSIWYDEAEQMIGGRKFVKVHIDDVKPGNKVFPIKVNFTDVESGKKAMLWMTTGGTVLKNRSFDALFSLTDVRLRYPNISDEVWSCIVAGKVQVGMTKDEVRLSIGAPSSINERPTHSGVREYWYYGNGQYLYFEDGVLEQQ